MLGGGVYWSVVQISLVFPLLRGWVCVRACYGRYPVDWLCILHNSVFHRVLSCRDSNFLCPRSRMWSSIPLRTYTPLCMTLCYAWEGGLCVGR